MNPLNLPILEPVFVKQIAIPQDHGSWVFLLSPLLIGIFAAPNFSVATLYLILVSLSVFLLRQPITIAIKAFHGRRSQRELPIARFWILIYGFIGLLSFIDLIFEGYGYLGYLAILGIPVFVWYLYLVSKRTERRQIGMEIIACGVLALSAPAAYWVGMGQSNLNVVLITTGGLLFLLTWIQSAASIVHAYLRLEQRELKIMPNMAMRLRMGKRAFLYTSFNLLAVSIFSAMQIVPSLLPLPYLIQWLETFWCIIKPAINLKPTRIGIRQLIVSTIFTVTFIITWNL